MVFYICKKRLLWCLIFTALPKFFQVQKESSGRSWDKGVYQVRWGASWEWGDSWGLLPRDLYIQFWPSSSICQCCVSACIQLEGVPHRGPVKKMETSKPEHLDNLIHTWDMKCLRNVQKAGVSGIAKHLPDLSRFSTISEYSGHFKKILRFCKTFSVSHSSRHCTIFQWWLNANTKMRER